MKIKEKPDGTNRLSAVRVRRITVNVYAIKLPIACLDYVIAHDLVHKRISNHSPAYWRMFSRVMPDWEGWRERPMTAET